MIRRNKRHHYMMAENQGRKYVRKVYQLWITSEPILMNFLFQSIPRRLDCSQSCDDAVEIDMQRTLTTKMPAECSSSDSEFNGFDDFEMVPDGNVTALKTYLGEQQNRSATIEHNVCTATHLPVSFVEVNSLEDRADADLQQQPNVDESFGTSSQGHDSSDQSFYEVYLLWIANEN